jgi:PAS domain S-box-containing protein
MFHHRQLSQAKLEREEFLNDLINAQPAAIYRVVVKYPYKLDPDGMPVIIYDFFSGQHEQIAGLTDQDLRNNPMKIVQRVHPDDRKAFIEENASAVKELRPFKWEGRVVVGDLIKWLRIESNPKVQENRDILWSGIIIDITREKIIERDLMHRKDFEKLLSGISHDFVNILTGDFDKVITGTLGRIGSFCDVDRAYLFLWDEKNDTVSNTHEWCNEGIDAQIQDLQEMPCKDIPEWMNEFMALQHVSVEDVNEMPDEWGNEKKVLKEQDILSVALVPVNANGRFIGYVGLDAVRNTRIWKDFEIQLLKVYADLLYNALDKRKSELELLESRQMLRTVLDTINVRVFWKDLDLNFMGCNRAFAFDGRLDSPEEVIGKNDYDMPWKHEADGYRENDMEVIRSGKPVYDIVEVTSFNGHKIDYKRTTKIPLKDTEGKIIGILGTSQNITPEKLAEQALRESENKYRVLTENAFDGIYLLGLNSFNYVNQRFCEMTGYSYDELVNENFEVVNIIDEQSRNAYDLRKRARIEKMELPRTYEILLKTKNGTKLDVEISTTPIGSGEDLQILGVVRDITQRKNNENLMREVAIAKQSVQFKQNFLANMSHEIRTPLTGVLGMIELLSNTQLDTQQHDFVNTLKLSTENLREIINQILDYSKIEAGQVKLRKDIFSKNTIFENAKKLFESICHKDIKLDIAIDHQIPEYISADEQRIGQVVYNLMSNAVKFTFQGKICIKAGLVKWLDDNKFILSIEISDTGIGIKKQFLKSLFLPFEQYDHHNNLYFEGTGLGLSISKELVELMGGEIIAASKEGKGSSFKFTVIAEKVDVNKINENDLSTRKSQTERKLRILYVEDKIINQKVVSLMLQSLGHEVTLAAHGQEALDKFMPGRFDLILMDIQMPVMDGVTATQILKEKFDHLPPVVGLSANAFEGDRQKYLDLGLDEYITKPVKANDFKELVNKLF